MKVVAQILGIGAMVSLFLIYQQKNRKKMILAKLSADIFWVLHYCCLGAIAGMIPNFVGIFREVVFINRKTKKWANLIIWPIVFIFINCVLSIITFEEWIDLLPISASIFVTISLWIDNTKLTKLISVPISMMFLIYDLYVGSYVGVLNEIIAISSIAIFFHKKEEKGDKCYEN